MPAAYADDAESDEGPAPSSPDDLSAAEGLAYAENNLFLLSCTLLVLLGCFGVSLLGVATHPGEPWWNSFLRQGTIVSVALVSFTLWGFYLAFPGDHFGIFPRAFFGFPGDIDPVAYDMGGITEWTDLFYIASYAALIGCLLLSFCSGGQTASSSFLISMPVVSLFFPFALSWKWGGGWIDALGNNGDFAGATLVHWHLGAVALLIGLTLTLTMRGRENLCTAPRHPILYLGGGIAYFAGVLGLNAGSTLEATPALVAAVLQSTLIAAAISAFFALLWWVTLRRKTAAHFFVAGLIAGAISVSGAADSLTLRQSVVLGTIAGLIVPGVIAALDRFRWVDPLSIGAVHGIGGIIGTFGACLALFDGEQVNSFAGQLVLLLTVPIAALFASAVVLVFCGAINLLVTAEKKKPRPPSLPGTA